MLQSRESVQFAESPRSPFRRARSRKSFPSLEKSVIINRKCESVGSLSAVNSQMSQEGLLRLAPIKPLVSEFNVTARAKTPDAVKRMRLKASKSNNREDYPALIELATFPGYTPDCVTQLPHRLNTLNHMSLITRAQDSFAKQSKFIIYWEELFYSELSQNIFHDVFWWFFLHNYQPDQHVQNQIFTRIAQNYILFLTKMPLTRYRDVFFKMYPDVLAQTVYSAFMHCFPTSWNNFDEKFKSELCNVVSLWFKGLKPMPENWRQWNFRVLEPSNLMRKISNNKINVKSLKEFDLITGPSHQQTYHNITMQKQEENPRKETKSKQHLIYSTPLIGPQFEHSVVDISCNTPLVIHFLQVQGLDKKVGVPCLIQHAAISQLPDKDSQTYFNVLKDSYKHEKTTREDFERNYLTIKQHMNKHSRERYKESLQHERNLRFLFSNRQQVRQLSNNLVINILSNQPDAIRKQKLISTMEERMCNLQN